MENGLSARLQATGNAHFTALRTPWDLFINQPKLRTEVFHLQSAITLRVYRVVATHTCQYCPVVLWVHKWTIEEDISLQLGLALFCDSLGLCRNQGDFVFTEMASSEMQFAQEIVVT